MAIKPGLCTSEIHSMVCQFAQNISMGMGIYMTKFKIFK